MTADFSPETLVAQKWVTQYHIIFHVLEKREQSIAKSSEITLQECRGNKDTLRGRKTKRTGHQNTYSEKLAEGSFWKKERKKEITWWTKIQVNIIVFPEFSKLGLMVDAKIIILINAAINVHRRNI